MNEQVILNPISDLIKRKISESQGKLKIAVPFINSFAKTLITKENTAQIKDKRVITRFDECNLTTFDLPTLNNLLNCGFEICYNNNIHLKLYIIDDSTFVTSSNLTSGGFENNIELTVQIDNRNSAHCDLIFEDLWRQSKSNQITKELIDKNLDKYDILRKRQKFEKPPIRIFFNYAMHGKLDIQMLIDKVFSHKEDHNWITNKIYEANKVRNELVKKIKSREFDDLLYYVPKGHLNRHDNLFHNLSYGVESYLASTGMRESQFKSLFEDKDFRKVIALLVPESIGLEPWNLNDEKQLYNFCVSLFDFDIPQYKEALPMRMASYFYPEHFLPIFKMDHLKKVCEVLKINSDTKSIGEKYYHYTLFLAEIMKDIPSSNYIKSRMFYDIYYSIELHERMKHEMDVEAIKKSFNRDWIKRYLDRAQLFLEEIKAIEN